MSYKIEKFNDKAGESRFRLVGPNGETMLSSEGYSTPGNRDRAILAVLAVFGCGIQESIDGGEVIRTKPPKTLRITESE